MKKTTDLWFLFFIALSFCVGVTAGKLMLPKTVQVKCAQLSCKVKKDLVICYEGSDCKFPGQPIDPSYFDCECLGQYTEPVP